MKILSIETSCDDTCISIMEMHGSFSARGRSALGGKVLANSSNSQIKIHVLYGGVYPVLAKREHAKNLPILLGHALKQATSPRLLRIHPSPSKFDGGGARGEEKSPVDLVAVASGPGLEMCLWEGINFAKNLAKKWNVPLMPVNHMEGHILSVFGKARGKFSIPPPANRQVGNFQFPILSLLVSGGHTQLVFSKKWMHYEIIGETLDDAVGEAFDKVARMLDLPYPGGPEISKLAENLRENGKQILRGQGLFSFSLPRPMLHTKDFNFSFAGLKTAVLYLIRDLSELTDQKKSEMALEFENAAIECLVYKTRKAVEKYGVKTLIVAGGVAANKHLRKEMQKITTPSPSSKRRGGFKNIKLLFPTQELAGDNSIMIGIAGYLNFIKNKRKIPKLTNIKAIGNLRL